jgi:HSP20 family protein
MATRNDAETRQQGQQDTTQRARQQTSQQSPQGGGTRQAGESGSEVRADRQRGLQTSREERPREGLVRSGASGRGLATGPAARSPFALMRRMMEDMDRMFEDFGVGGQLGRDFGLGRGSLSPLYGSSGLGIEPDGGAATLWSPVVEVFERGDKLVVRAEIPGVTKEDIDVDIADDVLTIEGERRQESEDRGEGYYRNERSYGRFFRSIPLPEGVDADKAEAQFRDGVLEVSLPAPKREQRRGRKLSIR